MVRQHDPRRPDANAIGRLPDMREHDRGRGARDPRHAVMLGDPVAFIAERPSMAGERSEERRVWTECVSTGRTRWSSDHQKKRKYSYNHSRAAYRTSHNKRKI